MRKQDCAIERNDCESVAYIPLRVCTPIELEPCMRILPISLIICGEPEVISTPCGTILTLNLCVDVPIEIDVKGKNYNSFLHNGRQCK
jgi:hypothetical protein